MNSQAKTTQNKRDLILTVLLLIILGGGFLLYRAFAVIDDAARAHVFYGTSIEPIVTIDFIQNEVFVNYSQNVPPPYDDIYPIINLENQTITLLGDFTVNDVRQVVVIKFDFERKSVTVIEEQSPNNICSREGESTGWPLICLPNRIRIEFEQAADEDFIV
jgi:hypothetical protein